MKNNPLRNLIIVSILILLTFASCNNNIFEPEYNVQDSGLGKVIIHINSEARTALPDEFVIAEYKIDITESGSQSPFLTDTSETGYFHVEIDPGTFIITVTAYNDSQELLATGQTEISIQSGEIKNAQVNLIRTYSSEGILHYLFNTDDNIHLLSGTFFVYSMLSGDLHTSFSIEEFEDSIILPSGYYRISYSAFILIDEKILQKTYTTIAHIYTGQTTPLVIDIDEKSGFIGLEMIFVPGGTFELGRNLGTGGGSNETPVSNVTMSGFYIGKYQVTQELYQAVMGTNPSYFHGGSNREPAEGEIQGRRPVETVSLYDVIVFCNRLSILEGLNPAYIINGSTNPNDWGAPTWWDAVQIVPDSTGYRLPTEAQWEYAAKGGNGSPGNYTYSGSNNADDVAWHSGNSGNRTHEVGKKAPNGLGIYDMSGNVWEWCWDRAAFYTSDDKVDPTGPDSGFERGVRGGGWNNSAGITRSVYRNSSIPSYSDRFVGFRVVRHAPITGTVSINGTAHVGQTLTAVTTSLGGSGTIFYQWMRSGNLIGTSSTYIVQTGDLGSMITLTVVRANNSGSVTSDPTDTIINPTLTGTVRISGTTQVGQTLTAVTTALGGSGTISYQWMRGGNVIGTSSTYIVQAGDLDSIITVTVMRANNTGSVISDPTSIIINPPLTGTVSIDGIALVGQTLTAVTSSLGGSGIITYQWMRSGNVIGTSSTYIVQDGDLCSTITLIVTRTNSSGSVTIATIGHQGLTSAFTATCMESGNSEASGVCTGCGHVVTGIVINALGHETWDWSTYNTITGKLNCIRSGCTGDFVSVGDAGPAGGKIIYIAPTGFEVTSTTTAFQSYTAYFLEAAPTNVFGGTGTERTMSWSTRTTFPYLDVAGIGMGMGSGRNNTALIIEVEKVAHPSNTYIYAALACDNYSVAGFNDWFLPSRDELYQLYLNFGFSVGWFWSSSHFNSDSAWALNFENGSQVSYNKSFFRYVHAVRAF